MKYKILIITFVIMQSYINLRLFSEVKSIKIESNQEVPLVEKNTKSQINPLTKSYKMASAQRMEELIYGNIQARISIIEYADIECAFCKKAHSGFKQIVDNARGVINWKFFHFPSTKSSAMKSLAIECVNQEYGNKVAWATIEKLMYGSDKIMNELRAIGLNGTLLQMCLDSGELKQKVNSHVASARNAGVKATPTFIIYDNKTNQKLFVEGYQTPEKILSAIQYLLNYSG